MQPGKRDAKAKNTQEKLAEYEAETYALKKQLEELAVENDSLVS